MAITVEDGTGLADAVSYVSVADADAYLTARGTPAAWTAAVTATKEQALVKATDYLDTRWGPAFVSSRLLATQALEWPRVAFYDRHGFEIEGLPANLVKATIEYAVRALSGALVPDLVVDDRGLQVTRRRVKAGPVETETEYNPGGGPMIVKPYPAADMLLSGLVVRGRRVMRA